MFEYKTAEATKTNLQDVLNSNSKNGWNVFNIIPTTSSFFIVFEREKRDYVEDLGGAIDELKSAVAPLVKLKNEK